MEALLIRIDMLRDRRQYVTILKQWLAELAIAHGRLVTMGDVHLLFIAAEAAKITQLLEFYATRTIDSNARGEVRLSLCRCGSCERWLTYALGLCDYICLSSSVSTSSLTLSGERASSRAAARASSR